MEGTIWNRELIFRGYSVIQQYNWCYNQPKYNRDNAVNLWSVDYWILWTVSCCAVWLYWMVPLKLGCKRALTSAVGLVATLTSASAGLVAIVTGASIGVATMSNLHVNKHRWPTSANTYYSCWNVATSGVDCSCYIIFSTVTFYLLPITFACIVTYLAAERAQLILKLVQFQPLGCF